MKEKPLVSIITVCYNAQDIIEKTLQSVANQSYTNIEHWLIDGGSQDDTLSIVKKYPHIRYISEPDKGIYDAMNKGGTLATGKYINFMNAGDTFFGSDTLQRVFDASPETAQVIYGDYQVFFQSYQRIIKPRPLDRPWVSITVCHQSVFYQKELLEKHPYSGKFITSDFEQFATLFHQNYAFYYVGFPIANYSDDGVSSKAKIKIAKELLSYIPHNDNSLKIKLLLVVRLLRVYIVESVRKLLPTSWFEFLSQKIHT